jgi:hypothetical protein
MVQGAEFMPAGREFLIQWGFPGGHILAAHDNQDGSCSPKEKNLQMEVL